MEFMDLLRYMVDNDASDIYITEGCQPMFRVSGEKNPGSICLNLRVMLDRSWQCLRWQTPIPRKSATPFMGFSL